MLSQQIGLRPIYRFVLGESQLEQNQSKLKQAMMTANLSLLAVLISMFYLFFDLHLGLTYAIPYYIAFAFLAFVSLFLNRMGYGEIAKVNIYLSATFFIYICSAAEPISSGNFFNFFPLIIAPFALFGYENFIKSISFSLFALIVFGVAFLGDYSVLPARNIPPALDEINFIIHFMVALLATLFMLVSISKLNFYIEDTLKLNEQNLLKVRHELEESQQRFSLAISGSNAGIYDWNIVENQMYHSPIWKNMLGYTDDELSDGKLEEFMKMVHPEDAPCLKEKLNAHLMQNERYSEVVRLRTKQGDYRWFIDAGQALWDNTGKPVRMVGSIVDITEKKLAEDRVHKQKAMLEKTNAELDRFLYSTSHDLRAPLMSMLGIINLAKMSHDEKELRDYFLLMQNRVERLDEFIGEIIDFTRNYRSALKQEHFKLKDIVDDVVGQVRCIDGGERVQIEVDVPPNLILRSDPERWRIVLKSLISNGIIYHNYTLSQPYVKVSAECNNQVFELTVKDNGRGIKPEYQSQIFDMFFRASEDGRGSGLGLYLAKESLTKIGGNISVTSRYGEGSSFSCKFKVPTDIQYVFN